MRFYQYFFVVLDGGAQMPGAWLPWLLDLVGWHVIFSALIIAASLPQNARACTHTHTCI